MYVAVVGVGCSVEVYYALGVEGLAACPHTFAVLWGGFSARAAAD